MVSGAWDIVSGQTGHGALGHGAHGTWSLTFRVCWSSMLLVMIATSSTHSRHVELVSMFVWVVHLALFISLLISSISVAYWVTASTPPCLMLLLILMPIMGLVMPCFVVMVAVRFWLRRSVRSHVAPLHPCLFITYMLNRKTTANRPITAFM